MFHFVVRLGEEFFFWKGKVLAFWDKYSPVARKFLGVEIYPPPLSNLTSTGMPMNGLNGGHGLSCQKQY